jgi:hypothetical protein
MKMKGNRFLEIAGKKFGIELLALLFHSVCRYSTPAKKTIRRVSCFFLIQNIFVLDKSIRWGGFGV